MTKPYTENGRDNDGRAELFTELYSGVYKELYRFALGYLGNREDAEDAVQDTAVEAFKGMEKLKDLSVRLTTRYLFENGYTMKKDKNGILSLIVKE